MQENFLIGIGGTGSRVLEAFVHCCAAGFGPKGTVNIMLIDPDGANGNLNRTQKLVEQYRALRDKLAPELEATNPAFRTELVTADSGFVWSVLADSNKTLAKYIDYDTLNAKEPSLAAAANLLFTGQELNTELNEGFRGHPAIGAVVMAEPPLEDPKSPLRLLTTLMAPNKTARIFLVGSIFGGTGAAGFPTIGKVLKQKLGGKWGSVLLGGALVLPYFSFKSSDSANSEQMFVTPNDFPAATKAALHYYDENELAFDQYYFIGDSVTQEVGKFSTGTATQENDPHYIELASALAVFDFFAQEQPKVGDGKQYFIAGRKSAQVSWDDLPITRDNARLDGLRREFREDISTFTLFCYTYRTFGVDYLAKVRKEGRLDDNWFRKTFKDYSPSNYKSNPGHDENRDLLDKKTVAYVDSFLKWITDIAKNENVQLIDRQMLLDRNGPVVDADGRPRLPLQAPRENLGRLVYGYPAKKNHGDFIANSLNGNVVDDVTKDAPYRLLNLFFRAAPDFLGFDKSTLVQR